MTKAAPVLTDSATSPVTFATLPPPLTASVDGGRLTSDGGLPWLAETDAALGLCAALAPWVPEWRRGLVRHSRETLVRQPVCLPGALREPGPGEESRPLHHALSRLPAVPERVHAPLTAASVAADLVRLQTIVGGGLLTAAIVVVETRPLRERATAAQVVAYAGLDPAPHESGTSVCGAGRISKTGNARLRQALYMSAVSAVRFNPPLRAFYQRLLKRGKPTSTVAFAG